MNYSVIYLLGLMLITLAIGMLICVVLALFEGATIWVQSFLTSAFLTCTFGGAITLGAFGFKSREKKNSRQDAIIFVLLFWFIATIFAMLPFYFSGLLPNVFYAYFESVSGLTTTGMTIYSNLDSQANSLLFWRAWLQWYGGLATIIFALSSFNSFEIIIDGFSQSHSFRGERYSIQSRLKLALLETLPIYCLLTVMAVISLVATGVSPFDGLVHGMTALATGGMSTRDGGIASFENPLFTAIVLFWCVVGALNFTLYTSTLRGRRKLFKKDFETKIIFYFLLLAFILLCALPVLGGEALSIEMGIQAIKVIVSTITTSGFIGIEGELLTIPILIFLCFLMLIGASVVSTSGGFKALKALLLLRLAYHGLIRMTNPRSVHLVRYAGSRVTNDVMRLIWVVFVIYILTVMIGISALSLCGQPLNSAFFIAIISLSNTGGIYGTVVNEVLNIDHFSNCILMIQSILMVMGRIELLFILVLFSYLFRRV